MAKAAAAYKAKEYNKNMQNTIIEIKNVISMAEKMKNAYFFQSPAKAAFRRYYEKQHSIPKVEWAENGVQYSAEFITSCSCAHVYAKGVYTRNGKKINLTAVRNSLKRLEKEFENGKTEI